MIEDPNGYNFELLERGPTPEPLCQVMLRVGDLDRSINFYKKVSNGTQFLNMFLYWNFKWVYFFFGCYDYNWPKVYAFLIEFKGFWHGTSPQKG